VLHLLNGDATARVFARTGLAGDMLVWRDILVEGPVATPGERAPWLAEHLGIDADAYVRGRREEAAALAAAERHDEVVLWFEQDLFCAVNLWFLLDWFAARGGSPARLSLVFPNEVDGVDGFRGLGTLDAWRLASLFERRTPVTGAMLALGRDAFRAYASPDPRALETLRALGGAELPFLATAVRCHLGRFPSVASGVDEVEAEALSALEGGPVDFSRLFTTVGVSARVRPHGMGDLQFAARLRELGRGPHPLVTLDPGEPAPRLWTLALTPLGRDVGAERADWLAHHRLDRWLGGVHLLGPRPPWRWDSRARRLVAS
jgi:hypothetical protein